MTRETADKIPQRWSANAGNVRGGDGLVWADSRGTTWHVELAPGVVRLRSSEGELEIPASQWRQDIYASAHAGGYIVRVETYDRSVGFLLPVGVAEPLLRHIGWTDGGRATAARQQEAPTGLLVWPKVSPLAVWALGLSALAFIPLVGLVPAAAAAVLLVVHRRTVRRSLAYAHSRALCHGALAFLILGLAVSALGTRTAWSTVGRGGPQRPDVLELLRGEATGGEGHRTSEPGPAVAASVWEREHNWGLIAAALLVVLFSLTVHEAAHAISAWWLGDDFARRLGRVTLNPIAHVDPVGTILLPLILYLSGAGVFGWARPVPVRLENVRRPRRAHMLIALAGPGSNLLVASGSMLLLLGVTNAIIMANPGASFAQLSTLDFTQAVTASGFAGSSVVGPLCTVLKLSFIVNVFLAFFNLIPVPPLDGSWVLEHLFPNSLGRVFAAVRPYSLLIFFGLIYANVLTYLLIPAFAVLFAGMVLLRICAPV